MRRKIFLGTLFSLLIFSLSAAINSYSREEDKKMMIKDIDANFFIGNKWIGVSVRDITERDVKELRLPELKGVLITDVKEGSPAHRAGLKERDVILEFDGERVRSVMALKRMVEETPEGRNINLLVWREGKTKIIITTVERQSLRLSFPPLQKLIPEFWDKDDCIYLGLELQDMGRGLRKYFGVNEEVGVLISDVEKDSLAERNGFKAGDIIIKINNREINRAYEVREFLCENTDLDEFNFTIIRDKKEINLKVAKREEKIEHT